MQMLNDLFTGHLSKFGAKVSNGDVYMEFNITHVSTNEPDQPFLDNLSEELQSNMKKCLNNPEWDSIKYTPDALEVIIRFDAMEVKAVLSSVKISRKDAKDLVFKYDLTFLKKQEQDIDTHFATYLKHKEENEEGKELLVLYDIEIVTE